MKKIFVFITVFILGLGFFPFGYSQALTIGPSKFEFIIDPGHTITEEIRLRNETDQTTTFYSSFETFIMKGDTPEPRFTGKREGLASWIETNPSQVTLEPGEGRSVSFTIRVPENADPGGHYAAIFWGTAAPEGGAGIGVVARMAVLVLLTVPGEVLESGQIASFAVDKKFHSQLPVNLSFSFKNAGTVHLKPQGEITIKNIFGRIAVVLPVGTEGHNVMPQQTRDFSFVWEEKGFKIGYYKALLNLQFGEKGAAQASAGFLVIPWKILLLTIFALAIVLFGISRGIRLYNRWIIAKARG